MVFSVITAAVFGAMGLYMMMSAKRSVTRRMAWIPLSMSAIELSMAGMVALGQFPALTAILMACRLTVLGCCVTAAKRDAAAERNRRRRREVWRRVAYDMANDARAVPILCENTRCA